MKRFLHYGFVILALLTGGACRLHAQNTTHGSQIFSTNCAGCHGADGRGGERAPNIATARDVTSLADTDLVNFVRNGIPGAGMPSFSFLGESGLSNVVAYLRVLQGKTSSVTVSGDATAGRTLFFGIAQCSQCHMMHGEGGFIASDLSDYGSGIAPERIRSAIVEPEKVVNPKSEVVEIHTATGEEAHGVVRAEDNFILLIQLENGHYRRLQKSQLASIHRTGHSLMPTDYKTRLSPKELDDLVSYLVRSATPLEPGVAGKKTGGSQ